MPDGGNDLIRHLVEKAEQSESIVHARGRCETDTGEIPLFIVVGIGANAALLERAMRKGGVQLDFEEPTSFEF